MYHGRLKGTHYQAGFKWGQLLLKNGKKLDSCPTFELTEERIEFGKQCKEIYKLYYPEILEEIKGIADGNETDITIPETILLTMYCFEFTNKCTCFAFKNDDEIVFARNSDFLVSLEKLYMNCLYNLQNAYSFNGNTTAYVQMEDGVNEHGLAVGLTFMYPYKAKPGFNAGMLVRYMLEKCKITNDVIEAMYKLPIASSQTLTVIDKTGDMAVIESNFEHIEIIRPYNNFVATANSFNSECMKKYINHDIDNWRAEERYQTAYNALNNCNQNYSIDLAKDILAGKYGFMCLYNRKTNADTVWSVVYDLKRNQIWRVEGNPSRKQFKLDERFSIL